MKKISMLIVFLLFAGLQVVLAQKTITGTVSGSSDNLPLAGSTVRLKGTATGNTTGIDGKYSIQVPDNQAILQFSFIGFNSQEVTVGNQSVVNVSLAEALLEMNEVVVTALGIKRESKSLGYAATQVNTQAIANPTSTNVGDALLGKVAGLNITSPSTGPGGSAKIRIRGQSSFGGFNSPLIVVNGVPINNSARIEASDADFGDGLQSINPDDIESMTVLKGASAAALYGFRAKDGVIIITTKNGSNLKKGLGIEFNTSFVADQVLDFTNFQDQYGQGKFGVRPVTLADARTSGIWSFGTKFDGEPFIGYDGNEHPYSFFKDRMKYAYDTGMNLTNSVALNAANEKGSMRVSFANTNATGIVPNSGYKKKIIDMGTNYKFTNRLTASVNMNYSIEDNVNPPLSTQDMSYANTIFTLSNSTDPRWLENPYKDPITGNEVSHSQFTNRTNPYWITNKRHEEQNKNRIYGNAVLRYQLTPWLYAQGRAGMDWYASDHNRNLPTGTASTTAAASGFNGNYSQDSRTNRETNFDFLLGVEKKFGSFGVNATFGGNAMHTIYKSIGVDVTNFYIRDLYTILNGQTKSPTQGFSEKEVNSFYGTLDLSYKDVLFLNTTVRNDWFSTLNPNSNSYLYPSTSLSFLFSQALKDVMPAWFDYGKVRFAYAEVGGDTDPFTNTLYYSMNANQFGSYPYGGISGSTSPNPGLKPLKVKETEIGMELIFFDRRISFDVAAYNKDTEDEILNVDISNTSGFDTKKVNVGKLNNKGTEMLLTLVPVRTPNFQWEIGINYTYNISEVIQLADGQTRLDVSGGSPWIGQMSHEVGKPLGSLRGNDYKRNDDGTILTVAGRFQTGDLKTFGSAVPKHIYALQNTFTYKFLRLFTQIDGKAGHTLESNEEYNFLRSGHSRASLYGREGGVIFPGFNVDGTPNSTAIEAESFYSDYSGKKVHTPFFYNASFLRFRTLSLGADLTKLVSNTFIKGLNINGSINNFFMIKKYTDNLDPECVSNVSDSDMGIEKGGLPTTRSYGLALNFKF